MEIRRTGVSHGWKAIVLGMAEIVILIALVSCSWFGDDRKESPTTPAGSAAELSNNYGGAAVVDYWCLTVSTGQFQVNIPQAGAYVLSYRVGAWSGDIVVGVSQAATVAIGFEAEQTLQDVQVQAATLTQGASGRDAGSGVTWYYGPGAAGGWSALATVDSSQAAVVLMEAQQLRVSSCPVVCPPCDCPPCSDSGGATCDLLNDQVAGNFTDNGDGTVSDSRTGLM